MSAIDECDKASIAVAAMAATDRFGRIDVVNKAGKAINYVFD